MAIGQSDGSIILTTQVDTSGLKKGLSGIKGGISSTSSALGKLGGIIGAIFSVGAIIKFSKATSDLATQTEASVQRLVDIYGSASKAVGDFIDQNSKAIGLSKSAGAAIASTYGNLLSVWADQATNAKLTNALLNQTAVVASKTGRTVEDVSERIRSGLLGNTEAIEDLGINVNIKTIEITDAFKQIADGRSWEQLNAYEQSQVRTLAILEQSTKKYGNEVAQTTALTKAQFQAAWQDFQATWGQVVNRVLMPILRVLTEIISTATKAMQTFFKVSTATVSQSDAIETATKKQNALTEAVEETAEAQEKSTANFDKLNILSSKGAAEEEAAIAMPTASGGATASLLPDTSTTETQFSGFVKRMQEILKPLATAFGNLFKPIKESFDKIDWKGMAKDFKEWSGRFSTTAIDTLAKGVNSLADAFTVLEEPLLNLWKDALQPIVKTFGEWIIDIVEQTGKSFDYVSKKLVEYKDEIAGVIDGISAIIQVIWSVLKPIINSVIQGIWPVLKTTIDFIFSIIQVLGNFFNFFKNLFAGIMALIKGDTDGALKYIGKSLGNFVNIFVGIGNAIISVVNNLWTLIFDAFKGTVNSVGGLVSKIGEWLGFDWDLQWNANAPLIPLIPKYAPKLAQGAVIPPNREFMAILGDQTSGMNIEAPEDLIRQIVREESGGKNFTIKATGSMAQLIRMLSLQITEEQNRVSVF